MPTISNSPRIVDIKVTEDVITAQLADGRTISVPLAWSWRLSEASPEQRNHFEFIGNGLGVHWPDVDEDISAAGMLHGIPARPPRIARRSQLVARPALAPSLASA
ncbi:MAG: DUF2442 domain-containing protein [Caldilineales bacterium]|nr:DUF2442 domain-containing protein [Caldilineales bacterium]MCW5861004.1 DUF2442 domain-containing protein [Caldilineales bacterium]